MAQTYIERRLFIFRVGMDIRNDLEALKQSGWFIQKGGHFLTREPDGSKCVNLFIVRIARK